MLLLIDCKKKLYQDVQPCDTMGDYYEDGEHYISREFINDETGTLNYEKQFEKMKQKNSDCSPVKTFEGY